MGRGRERLFRLLSWLTLLCIVCTGCSGRDILGDIPREYALSEKVLGGAPEAGKEGRVLSLSREKASLEETALPIETAPAVDFLMKEAFPYARRSLSREEQIWYCDIEKILGSFGEKGILSPEGLAAGLDENCIDRIFQCVLNDHPELFYVEGYSYTKYSRGDALNAIDFSGTYNVDLDTAIQRAAQIQAAADAMLAGIRRDAPGYEKVKYVYETLIRNTDYDLSVEDNQNIYSVFAHHLSVCQGYAKATQYLLNRLGVECTLVLGTVETGEGHAWNLVRVDGNYYYVDTTWGDVSYQIEEASSQSGIQIDMPEINYDYLNVTSEELFRTHRISGAVPMPPCVATAANYYVREGAFFTFYDRIQMSALFQRAIGSGKSDVTIKCADAVCYEEITDALIGSQEIFSYLENQQGSVAYAHDEKQLSLTFWVTNE